ncbi:MAG: cytochrome C oxidase subunit IV family protein [Gemmataceae bacterium]
MTDSHATDSHAADSHGGHDMSVKPYLIVFGALCVFTLVSFVVYEALGRGTLAPFIIILGVAFAKAILVAAYFMHLTLDWGKVFMIIIPALLLGPMLVVVLLPDIVLGWYKPLP